MTSCTSPERRRGPARRARDAPRWASSAAVSSRSGNHAAVLSGLHPVVLGVRWGTTASPATAGGTLVLAIATFASVRSANRAAREWVASVTGHWYLDRESPR
jgi:hypothetical protein